MSETPTTSTLSTLRPDPRNANKGTQRGREALRASLRKNGAGRSILLDKNGAIIAGNKTAEAAGLEGFDNVIIVPSDGRSIIAVQRTDLDLNTDPEARELAYADNRIGELSLDWDAELLLEDLEAGLDIGDLFRREEMDELLASLEPKTTAEEKAAAARKTLVERFGVPPFSVLDARQGYWQSRKQAWIDLGIRGELGRGAVVLTTGANSGIIGGSPLPLDRAKNKQARGGAGAMANKTQPKAREGNYINGVLAQSDTGYDPTYYVKKRELEAKLGRELTTAEYQEKYYSGPESLPYGTSIFDPVLAELAYRWFCPPGGLVINPTAGESVYGLVASFLGFRYKGVELRSEQVEANRAQAADMGLEPEWILGDGRDTYSLVGEDADFIICCPPYFDLEVYSDDPGDLSTMGYEAFLEAYRTIVAESLRRLKPNRFAMFVVGDIRDKKGIYRNFVGETTRAFLDAGASLYNEAVLISPVGSLAVRVSGYFAAGRKLGKQHQNVLVFVKGDPKKAVEACGPIEVDFELGENDIEGD